MHPIPLVDENQIIIRPERDEEAREITVREVVLGYMWIDHYNVGDQGLPHPLRVGSVSSIGERSLIMSATVWYPRCNSFDLARSSAVEKIGIESEIKASARGTYDQNLIPDLLSQMNRSFGIHKP
ncbi:hypothetical protein AYL99_11743 [Fonsecaea erecta]|uniref:Uncharacterized protein n=1 Tax=Fonsecaea erecta TaxID=1367422 RepID=A0A178Z322_9EURO|nr:hypothetical protein AYL99_11743 [Fonsecaea erecta]OAP54208.1 hypothetical protein AYL99_11743 [Fonsecaea erecta]